MSNRDLDLRDNVGLTVPFSARFVSSTRRAVLVVVVSYVAMVTIAAGFLTLLEVVQGYHDMRTTHAIVIFGVVMAFPFGWALFHAFRRPRPPTYQRLSH